MDESPAAKKFKHSNFRQSEEMEDAFKNIFGLEEYRVHQLEAIKANILKKNVFVVGDNGAGKSLCYQLPACLSAGVTVVISPLKALNLEQIKELTELGIMAWTPSDDQSERDQNRIYIQLINEDPKIKLLYVTPEKMRNTALLIKALKSLNGRKLLARFVIDEAQCIIEVGYDFRPDYGTLNELLKKFRGVPIMALSGPIGPGIQEDILNQLQMTKDQVFTMPFNRFNLKYAVEKRKTKSVEKDCFNWIKKHCLNDSGIVYCWSKEDCKVMASSLNKYDLLACSYHSDMTDEDRESAQNKWNENEYKVICATSAAFGMGIHKPDVRYVIHSFLPESMEHYHRETGRAGRDGKMSRCILFYSDRDEGLLQPRIMETTCKAISRDISNDISSAISSEIRKGKGSKDRKFKNLKTMMKYCRTQRVCRKIQLLTYFGMDVIEANICLPNSEAICDICERANAGAAATR
ncbi:unnamed protein product [Arctogadus glacialis]